MPNTKEINTCKETRSNDNNVQQYMPNTKEINTFKETRLY